METCRLWVSLGSGRRHRDEPRPSTFLRFIRTGLLVGLPDEPGGQLMEDGPIIRLPMRRVDAEGLGLTAEDFAEGVAICREDPATGALGWRCDRVQLLIGAEERIEALAPRARSGTAVVPSARVTAEPAPAAVPRRILVVVDAEAPDHAVVDEAAALAREHGAALLLVATGELPESARHAAEERAALTRRLEELSAPLRDLSVRTIVEMGGDPVRDILTVADEHGADLIIAPEARSRFADAIEPRIAAALERRSGVPVRAVSAPPRGGASDQPSAPAPATEARIVIAGLPRAGAADPWSAAAATLVQRTLAGTVFADGRLAVDARWYAATGSAVDHFALATVIDAVVAQPAWPAAITPRVERLASERVGVADVADERLEVIIRAG